MAFTDDMDSDNEAPSKPSALIVRNLPDNLFTDDDIKKNFESLFVNFGTTYFTFLPGFRRVIVKFVNGSAASDAKNSLHEKEFEACVLKVFFKEEAKQLGEPFLKLPKAEKLFLISPPASPPVGWEQIQEDPPVVNYELLSAVAKLEIPGKPVELVSKTESTPGIIVVGCEDVDYGGKPMKSIKALRRDEVQTQRPPI
jgi:Calcipressin.